MLRDLYDLSKQFIRFLFEGEIKSHSDRKVIFLHLQEMKGTDKMSLKANEKALCQACCSRAMSASEMGCCLWGNDLQHMKTILVLEPGSMAHLSSGFLSLSPFLFPA